MFNSFSFGIHAYTQGGLLDYINSTGNTLFGHGVPSQTGGAKANIIIGPNPGNPARPALNAVFRNNYSYYKRGNGGRALDFAYNGVSNAIVDDNYLAGDTAFDQDGTIASMKGNTFYGAVNFTTSQYPTNTYFTSRPTGVRSFVRPNRYEPGRAHITIFNWDNLSSVSVNVGTAGIADGTYVLRNAQNYWQESQTLSVSGGQITVPMTGWTVVAPIGWTTPPNTFPEFGVFVLLPSGTAPPPPPPSSAGCDVNRDGIPNVIDVQLTVNQILNIVACTADLNRDGKCDVTDLQRVTNAALGGPCLSS
jgi:hypothetical protein